MVHVQGRAVGGTHQPVALVRASERDAGAQCRTPRSGVGLSSDGVKPGSSQLG